MERVFHFHRYDRQGFVTFWDLRRAVSPASLVQLERRSEKQHRIWEVASVVYYMQ